MSATKAAPPSWRAVIVCAWLVALPLVLIGLGACGFWD
jgi:hypothetical protein